MPDQQARQAQALENIARATRDLVTIFAKFNENVVAFSRQIAESDERYDKIMKEKGDMMALIPRDPNQMAIDEVRNKTVDATCPGCDLFHCRIPDCGQVVPGASQ